MSLLRLIKGKEKMEKKIKIREIKFMLNIFVYLQYDKKYKI
jgi:hypothetical protein